jgi:hypothetical protein
MSDIIIYNTKDGKARVALFAKDGDVWMNQNQLAELFATSVPNISMHIANILKENELNKNSVIKDYLTTAADGKNKAILRTNSSCIIMHATMRQNFLAKFYPKDDLST